jgi:hypothetical protein
MMTLDDLCAHLLPPDDHITFQSLIIDEPRLILVATMISANSTCPDCSLVRGARMAPLLDNGEQDALVSAGALCP